MKKPKTLKECKSGDEIEKYIIDHDGLSDEDVEGFEFVELGPDDDVAEIIPVPLDSETAKRIRRIAKKAGKTPNMLIRDWATSLCRRDPLGKKQVQKSPRKRAAG
jgi:hypothetical protein